VKGPKFLRFIYFSDDGWYLPKPLPGSLLNLDDSYYREH